MQTYREYSPTKFDVTGLNGDKNNISDFLVLLGRNRDSDILTEVNFEVALEILGGESDTVQVHRFGHWACGWFELLLVHPSREIEAQAIEDDIEHYPILDEDKYYLACEEARTEYWNECSISERVDMCRNAGISIFSARLNYCPDRSSGESLLESIC